MPSMPKPINTVLGVVIELPTGKPDSSVRIQSLALPALPAGAPVATQALETMTRWLDALVKDSSILGDGGVREGDRVRWRHAGYDPHIPPLAAVLIAS